MQGRHGKWERIGLGVLMPMFPAALLAQWQGHIWQLDLHLSFLAVIALVAVMADWRPIAGAATVTAVHHLVVSVAAPALIFADDPEVGRVLLHAAFVIVECIGLIFLARNLQSMIIGQSQEREAREQIEREASAERERLEAEAASERNRLEAIAAADLARIEEERRVARAKRDEDNRIVINALSDALSSLAEGDLSVQIREPLPGEAEALREQYNNAVRDLGAAFEAVTQTAKQIQSGTQELRAASDDLSTRTEAQASSLQSAAAACNRLTETVTGTAETAADVSQSMIKAQSDAQRGRDVVEQAISAMQMIQRKDAEINQIISIIDGIAFQTNLLALNAGVEAARAGDAGRGFAVVANEVRALAQRSAEAAKKIKELIEASGKEVTEGVNLVEATGTMFQAIVDQIVGIETSVREIAEKVEVQARDLQGVNGNISSLEQSTQHNAAMVEETTAALHSLANETTNLTGIVGKFRTLDSHGEVVAMGSGRRPARLGSRERVSRRSAAA
jgi:methyl-accepting chemotaxis protein